MSNPQTDELMHRLRNTAAMQRSIGLTAGADMLESAASTIADLAATVSVLRAADLSAVAPAGRVITTRDEALALRAGAVVVNEPGKAYQIKPTPTAADGYIEQVVAAYMLPLTVIHEGDPA